ncbi:MAG: serine/threonine protein kinase [Myxococcales bacterium]|nr:serine/threonine protein kinase [Myxococcales bacterium]
MGEEDKLALVGRVIAGKFQILEHIGGGAMGEVYKARHKTLDSLIALKVMRKDLSDDPLFAARFEREAKAASKLEHPNSIRVVDHGREPDGLTYIAMEFLPGRDLLRVISDDWPLTEQRIIEILLQVLSALGVAHGIGIIHRDLKPENIMVLESVDDDGTRRDQVKVCDFGIAKISDPRGFQTEGGGPARALTTHGTLVGTPEYMSPEQARGDTLDARSDLYSVGVILYQLLTGRVPFIAENALGVVLKQVTDEPEAPSLQRPGMTIRLEEICLKALRKRPEDRYQTAKDMRADLRGLVSAQGYDSSGSYNESNPIIVARPRVQSNADTLQASPTPRDLPIASPVSGPDVTPPLGPAARIVPPHGGETNTGTLVSPFVQKKGGGALYAALGLALVLALALGGVLIVPRLRGAGTTPQASAGPAEVELKPLPVMSFADPLPTSPTSPNGTASGKIVAASATARATGGPSGRPLASASASASASSAVASPPPSASAAPPAAPFDPSHASIVVGMINASGVSQVAVRSKVRTLQPALSACYRTALAAKGTRVDGNATLSLSVDEKGRISACVATGIEQLPQAARCFQSTLVGQDLGAAAVEGHGGTAEVWLQLKPE